MSCYYRHMKDIFEAAGVEVTKENKKQLDKVIHELVGGDIQTLPVGMEGSERTYQRRQKKPVAIYPKPEKGREKLK